MKVLLIGSYPPPLGGVSVFLKRYRIKLEAEGHLVELLDPTRLSNIRLIAEITRAKAGGFGLVSLHYPSFPLMKLLHTLGMLKETEVWDHNWRLAETWDAGQRQRYESWLRNSRALILVTPNLADYYREHEIALPIATRVESPFLPPPEAEESAILDSYTDETREFIAKSRPLLVANAFKLAFHKDVDLYGADLCVQVIAELKQQHPRIGLVFALAEIGDTGYFKKLQLKIADRAIEKHIHFLTGQKELWPLFKKADLMVRPTASDGYALSVAEAIHFGCPVVASDVTARPPEAVVFRNRDSADFLSRCQTVLQQLS